jgi:hypothetical protein
LKNINTHLAIILEPAWSHMSSYEETRLVVEAVNIADRYDLLKRKGSTEKPDRSTFLDFPFKNLDP